MGIRRMSWVGDPDMFVGTARDWGNIVRDRRTDLGMTQAELAERIGKARQWVVRFESGHAGSASVDSLVELLEALALDVRVDPLDLEDPDPMFMDIPSTDPFER
ncbi:XRE family transcriptional regulator [Agromyces protaetiae]|uniref:XRE family transcriptional regulator n=1 Tax=Agromyces protaetiae TaxID=2509455 RepID=A0A4P6FF77_9MICO|nr:helix-turn-helix transcriptional regulator [Agromyces protaetiae]QAY73713.1 XRE family transcriptional regulator [Agromyces protaetiae]